MKTIEVVSGQSGHNLFLNSNFDIAQRGTSFPAIENYAYSLDRWIHAKAGDVSLNITQDTDVPTGLDSAINSIKLEVATADTSIGATDFCVIGQKIEGYNAKYMYGKTYTLSFWVKTSVIGTYCVFFKSATGYRQYAGEYTTTTTDWEPHYITLTHDTTGTWNTTNGVGIQVYWVLSCGSSYTIPGANAWYDGNYIATSNQINATATIGNTFKLSQVMLHEGKAPLSSYIPAGRNITDELAMCQRYYQILDQGIIGGSYSTTQALMGGIFPTTMRASAVITQTGVITVHDPAYATYTQSAPGFGTYYADNVGMTVLLINFSGLTNGRTLRIHGNSLIATSEL